MRKYILLLVSAILCSSVYATMPRNGDYSGWNWEDLSESNWMRNVDNVWKPIYSPFEKTNLSQKTELLKGIVDTEDYKLNDGWRLVTAHFGTKYPYFILYNKYDGLLRTFFFTGDLSYSTVGFSIRPSDMNNSFSYQSKLLFFGQSKQVAVNDPQISKESLNLYEKAGKNSWAVFQTPILFDNKISDIKGDWVLEFHGITTYKVAMNINGRSVPIDADGRNLLVHQPLVKGNNPLANYSKIHKSVDGAYKAAQKLEALGKRIGEVPAENNRECFQEYKRKSITFSDAVNVVKTLTGVSGGIEVASGIFDLIFGKTTTKGTTVHGYEHSLSVGGDVYSAEVVHVHTIPVPGSKNSGISEYAYNNPMGVINLTNTPRLKGYSHQMGFDAYGTVPGRYAEYGSESIFHNHAINYPASSMKVVGSTIRYKLLDDINLNKRDDVDIIDVKFAILLKDSTDFAINTGVYLTSGYSYKMYGPVFDQLFWGEFVIHEYNKDENIYIYGTPYMDKNEIKEVIFDVYAFRKHIKETDISLGIIAKYRIKGTEEFRFFKGTYKLDEGEVTNYDYAGWSSGTLKSFSRTDYWVNRKSKFIKDNLKLHEPIVLAEENNSIHRHPNFILKEGFVGKIGFSARSTYTVQAYGNTQFYSYAYNDISGPRVATRSALDIEEVAAIDEEVAIATSLSPNPTTGVVNLSGYVDVNKIEVYSVSGQLASTFTDVGDSFDISHLSDGMYIVRVFIDGDIQTHRIILRR